MSKRSKAKSQQPTTTSPLKPVDLAMFAEFKIPKRLLDEAGVRRVTDAQARAQGIGIAPKRAAQNMAGILFPYSNSATGDIVTLRLRRDHPEIKDGKLEDKYLCPSGPRGLFIHPRSAAKLTNTSIPIVLVEAEKSALALTALAERQREHIENDSIPIAMGGCWGWSQDKQAIPALLELCKGHPLYILLDANAATNPDVKAAQSALAAELSTPAYACPEVLIASMPQFEGVNGPDDLIAQNDGDNLLLKVLEDAEPAGPVGEFSDDALALEFTRQNGENLRYVNAWGRWLAWDGTRWKYDDTLSVYDKARRICRDSAEQCGKQQTAQRVRSAQTVSAVERLARADRKHAATVEQWDANSWVLNTPAGVVDLRTGRVRPAAREDYCAKITAAALGGDCSLWRKFLSDITAGDKDLQSFLQRMCGYALTGATYEHALFFLYGTGANGKSVFLSAITGALGEYAQVAPVETFTASQNDAHPTDLAGLQGARLVVATETEEGKRWAESKLKALTGGDRISARFMRQDFFEFTPQFKLVVCGNHRPGLRSVDEAMRRRMNLVPFSVTIPAAKRDGKLAEKLRAEWGGILAWAIEGCLMWQRDGLAPPKAVTSATNDYMDAEDSLGRWLGERTNAAKNAKAGSGVLFLDWRQWAESTGEYTGSQKRFSQALEARGFALARTRNERVFIGLRLLRAGEGVTDVTRQPNEPYREISKPPKLSNGLNRQPVTSVTPKKFTRAGARARMTIQ